MTTWLLILLLYLCGHVTCNNNLHGKKFTRPPVHIPDAAKIAAHHNPNNKVLVIVPGFGWYGNRGDALTHSLLHLKRSTVPVDCMIYIYLDYEPPNVNQTQKEILHKICEVIQYHYGNYGDYLKTLPPFLLRKAGYSHVMILLDDVKLHSNYNLDYALQLMVRNNLTIVQPAVHGAKFFTTRYHSRAEYKNDEYYIGHTVEMAETFATVFTLNAWECWFNMINPLINSAGWGYDAMVHRYCRPFVEAMGIEGSVSTGTVGGNKGYFGIGVLDCMEATHIDRYSKVPMGATVESKGDHTSSFKPAFAVNHDAKFQKWEWVRVMLTRRNATRRSMVEGAHNAFLHHLVDID